jgi:hypothetical protein
MRTAKSGARTAKSGARTAKSGARTAKSGARTAKHRGPVASLDALVREQTRRLGLEGVVGLATRAGAAAFLAEVGFALRYGPSDTIPLASMYRACARPAEDEQESARRATIVTNELLGARDAVEVNVIADRLVLAHRTTVPSLLVLRRRGRAVVDLELSEPARRVLDILPEHPRPTAGFVRARYGVPAKTWPNPADDALAELQRNLVIDRGPTDVPERGAAYLGKDGIPYRLVDAVHGDIVRAARALDVATAATVVLSRYLDGAVFATRRKLASLFAACWSADELGAAIDALARSGGVEIAAVDGKELIVRVGDR